MQIANRQLRWLSGTSRMTDMDTWISVIAALLGTALGGGIGFLGTFMLKRREESVTRKKLLLTKLEEIYETAIKIEVFMGWAWAVAVHEATHQERVPREDQERVPLERLRMLAELYFPSLVPAVNNIESTHHNLGPFMVEANSAAVSGDRPRVNLMNDLNEAHEALRSSVRQFLDEAVKLTQRYL